jgi:drug/metabolite transporter (DMT)-like permease
MHPHRHLSYFIALGLFWGLSPSLYKHLSDVGMPLSHTIAVTGLGVGLAMYVIAGVRSGQWWIGGAIHRYGAICAFLMNLPFGLNLFLAGHVPPTELAIIITLSPLFNYALALVTGWENAALRRLLAIAAGLLSTLVLILTRGDIATEGVSWWLISALAIPLLYCGYNTYAALCWPRNANTLQAGAVESFWSGILAVPAMIWVAAQSGDYGPAASHYWILVSACVMWIVERISYFTLISEKGAVYTVQATYVATPAAVVIAALFFGGANDIWLWLSLALLMVALYLNNSGRPATPTITPAAKQPSS